MSSTPPPRAHYFAGQFLRAGVLSADQRYHAYLHEAHQREHHTHGVVRGLELKYQKDAGRYEVSAGHAVAPDGHTVLLPHPLPIELAEFDRGRSDELTVYLVYRAPDPVGRRGLGSRCNDPGQGDSERVQDTVSLVFRRPSSDVSDLPPGRRIRLGRMVRDFADPKDTYKVTVFDREEVGLVGARVTAPSGLARLDLAPADNPDRRFAVVVEVEDIDQGGVVNKTQLAALELSKDGRLDVHRDLWCHGDLRLQHGALQFGVPDQQAEKKSSVPWSIRRVETENEGDAEPKQVSELRVELGPSGRFTVGAFPAGGEEFQPILTVNEEGVQVNGYLYTDGIVDKRDQIVLNETAERLLTGTIVNGPTAAQELVAAFNSTRFQSETEIFKEIIGIEFSTFETYVRGLPGSEWDEFLKTKIGAKFENAALVVEGVNPNELAANLKTIAEPLLAKNEGPEAIALAPADQNGCEALLRAIKDRGDDHGRKALLAVAPEAAADGDDWATMTAGHESTIFDTAAHRSPFLAKLKTIQNTPSPPDPSKHAAELAAAEIKAAVNDATWLGHFKTAVNAL